MYLLTTINVEECGWEIVTSGTKEECQKEMDNLKKKVWFNSDGSQKMFSDIYDDTRAKNAIIVSNKKAASLFGGQSKLDLAEELRFEEMMEHDLNH